MNPTETNNSGPGHGLWVLMELILGLLGFALLVLGLLVLGLLVSEFEFRCQVVKRSGFVGYRVPAQVSSRRTVSWLWLASSLTACKF